MPKEPTKMAHPVLQDMRATPSENWSSERMERRFYGNFFI